MILGDIQVNYTSVNYRFENQNYWWLLWYVWTYDLISQILFMLMGMETLKTCCAIFLRIPCILEELTLAVVVR